MRYVFFTLLLCLSAWRTAFSQVASAEYYIDTDPGYGNAITVSVPPGGDVSRDFTIDLASQTAGFHIVGVRAKDAQGHWSHTYLHSYIVTGNITATAATASEYFIDTDPGTGKATQLSTFSSPDASLNYVIPLNELTEGFHVLGIRVKDNFGKWSHTMLHSFFINEYNEAIPISALQYYFTGDGATDSIYTYQLPEPSSLIDLDFAAGLSRLVANREYTMHIWAVNTKGGRSAAYLKKIKVCSSEVANAGFDFIPLGTQVSFSDSSRGASIYKWDFGDGKVDSVSSPVHIYTTGGNYTVRQIVSNFCNSDTVVKVVNVVKVYSIFPNAGGNIGRVSVIVNGRGFNTTSIVKIVNVLTNEEVTGDTAFVDSGGTTINTAFELVNATLGFYNIIVKTGVISDTLKNGFEVELGRGVNVSVDIVGRNILRRGRSQYYEITYTNTGNIDAKGVPIWFAVPKDADVDLNFEVLVPKNDANINFDTIPIAVSVDSLFGEPFAADIYSFILRSIPPSFDGKLGFNLTVTSNDDSTKIYTWISDPLYASPLKYLIGECADGVIKEVSNFIPVAGCAYAVFDFYTSPFVSAVDISQYRNLHGSGVGTATYAFGKTVLSTFSPILKMAANCAVNMAGGGLIKTAAEIYKGMGVFGKAKIGSSILYSCKNSFNREKLKSFALSMVQSFDPNEKVGPTGNTIANHHQGTAPFNYIIYFENKSTATAPAQEVVIIDTLDISKFDLSTFQLQSFGYGNSTKAYIPAGLSAYFSVDTLHRTGKPNLLVKTDAKLDTANGILTWRFISLDPQTRELVDNPLDGFLPPNITSPQGEGFVSYSIRPKAALLHGTEISNKASIYFDNNEPIITNEFLNTLDKVSPVSAVKATSNEVADTTFSVQWNGSDNGAGIRSYDVYYKINNGEYQLWKYDVSSTQDNFIGQYDSVYSFFSISKDYAGNIENPKTGAERTVTVKLIKPEPPVSEPSESLISIYPNPAQGSLNVRFNEPQAGNIKWRVVDAVGRVVFFNENQIVASNSFSIDIIRLPKGIYYLGITGAFFNRHIKFVKQ